MKEEIGLRIKKIREDMGMSKEDFARKLNISGQYLGILEKGKSCLSIEKLKNLCDFTGFSADYILFVKDYKLPQETQSILSKYSIKQLESGCDALKDLALFISNL